MKSGIELIAKERHDQIHKNGWNLGHDAHEHGTDNALTNAATAILQKDVKYWPGNWDEDMWERIMNKPRSEQLAIAGALMAAEIDREIGLEKHPYSVLSIGAIQDQLPWVLEYSKDFQKNPQGHKDFSHAVLHVTKALGKIATVPEHLDHRDYTEHVPLVGLQGYVADLVICAMRMANTSPTGKFDLQEAVEYRIESKNNVKLTR